MKYAKQSVNLCKKLYGKESESYGKLTVQLSLRLPTSTDFPPSYHFSSSSSFLFYSPFVFQLLNSILQKPRVVSAVAHQHDVLPLRQLGLGFLLGLMGLPTLKEKDEIFAMRFRTGAMANLYAMYIPVGEGHVELAYSLLPLASPE